MDFALTAVQEELRGAIRETADSFSVEYWLDKDRKGEFPEDFFRVIADQGWLGIAMPEAYGGAGLGRVRVDLVKDVSQASLEAFVQEVVEKGSRVRTDA